MRVFTISLLLAFRQIQRANRWTTILIVSVMTLTFLNLVVVSGILVGLPVGAELAVKEKSLGDVVITPLDDEEYILQTEEFRNILETLPTVTAFSIRYEAPLQIEANYTTRTDVRSEPNIVTSPGIGIEAVREQSVSDLANNIIEGAYLEPDDTDGILLGALTLQRYTADFADITGALEDVYPGDKVRVRIGDNQKEYIVRGIIDAKGGEIANAAFIHERELRRLDTRIDRNANKIIIRTTSDADAREIKDTLLAQSLGSAALIRTYDEALPKFITDIKQTFSILGLVLGAIGIIVAAITIFIIIFINALSRRRQIGILKGIGIDAHVIELAYVLQAIFYVVVGSLLGAILVFGFLIGYFDRNPIDFPFSDGILVAEPLSTFWRFATLFVATFLAGLVPAWIITRGDTLNAILGRS